MPALLRELSAPAASGSADLARAIDATREHATRPGLLVVLSDFFDPGPVTRALSRAAAAGHQVALIQVLAREEIEPTFDGDYSLVDSETGGSVELSMDAASVDAYVARLAGLIEELRSWARKHRASYVRLMSDEPLEGAVRRFVARAID